MKYEWIRYHSHARKRMRRRKISRAKVERTLQLAAEGVTAEGNTVFVYYVETGLSEALVLSVKRRGGIPTGERKEP